MQILLFSYLLIVSLPIHAYPYSYESRGSSSNTNKDPVCKDTVGTYTVFVAESTIGIYNHDHDHVLAHADADVDAGKEERTCKWVGERVRPRCDEPAAQANCPVTCGMCPTKAKATRRRTTPSSSVSRMLESEARQRQEEQQEQEICVGDKLYEYLYYYDAENYQCYRLQISYSSPYASLFAKRMSKNDCNWPNYSSLSSDHFGYLNLDGFSNEYRDSYGGSYCKYVDYSWKYYSFRIRTIVSEDIKENEVVVEQQYNDACSVTVTLKVPPCDYSFAPSISSMPTAKPSISLAPSVSSMPTIKPSISLAPSVSFMPTTEPSIEPSLSEKPSIRRRTRALTPQINKVKMTNVIIFLTILAFVLVLCILRCAHTRARNGTTNLPPQPNEQTDNTTTRSPEEEKHSRRLKVLTSIIHKKVLSRSQAAGSDSPNNLLLPHEKPLSKRKLTMEESLSDNGSVRSTAQARLSSFIAPVPLPFAHSSSEYSNRAHGDSEDDHSSSVVPIAFPFGRQLSENGRMKGKDHYDDDSDDESDNEAADRKDDIYLESFQRSQVALDMERMQSASSLYSPKSCPICLEEYKVGDEIAWSKNDQCPHAFHLDCALDWLMDHDECPLCRGDYLQAGTNI